MKNVTKIKSPIYYIHEHFRNDRFCVVVIFLSLNNVMDKLRHKDTQHQCLIRVHAFLYTLSKDIVKLILLVISGLHLISITRAPHIANSLLTGRKNSTQSIDAKGEKTRFIECMLIIVTRTNAIVFNIQSAIR